MVEAGFRTQGQTGSDKGLIANKEKTIGEIWDTWIDRKRKEVKATNSDYFFKKAVCQ